ncbi:MAG: di-trans,poly-cis-decaprenylcistransferase [Proteobacteria bacterium]|nr:di-trans,poly-cis-decaprenylcistransferase [Pseudomonadota bacterium]
MKASSLAERTAVPAVQRPPRGALGSAAAALDAVRRALLAPLYRAYEHSLAAALAEGPMPRHVGIILDGNRRFGRARGLTDFASIYAMGAAKLDDVLAWCADLRIPMVTLWVCSPDNLARPEQEVSGILRAIEAKMAALAADPAVQRLGVKVEVIGRLDLLPPELLAALDAAKRATAGNARMTLTIAVGYGGREEIADAVRGMLHGFTAQGLTLHEAAQRVTPEAIRANLYVPDLPDPDLIIRTSGEVRLSGFMLWQSAYSEFYFTDVNWPEFRRIDLLRAIRSFQMRDRRLGR